MNVHKRCHQNVSKNCGVNDKEMALILRDMGLSGNKLTESMRKKVLFFFMLCFSKHMQIKKRRGVKWRPDFPWGGLVIGRYGFATSISRRKRGRTWQTKRRSIWLVYLWCEHRCLDCDWSQRLTNQKAGNWWVCGEVFWSPVLFSDVIPRKQWLPAPISEEQNKPQSVTDSAARFPGMRERQGLAHVPHRGIPKIPWGRAASHTRQAVVAGKWHSGFQLHQSVRKRKFRQGEQPQYPGSDLEPQAPQIRLFEFKKCILLLKRMCKWCTENLVV